MSIYCNTCKRVFDEVAELSFETGRSWCVDVAVHVVPGPAVDVNLGVAVNMIIKLHIIRTQ